MDASEAVLSFWFGNGKKDKDFWFKKDPKIDAYIKEHFEEVVIAAEKGKLDAWAKTPRGCLALIIVLDQFTRNIYRDTPHAFSGDRKSLVLARGGIEKGLDKELTIGERAFFYMPFMHAEDRKMQEESVCLFSELAKLGSKNLKWAKAHKEIIDRFGRFPHRNRTLGRTSTDEEEAFLKTPGSSF